MKYYITIYLRLKLSDETVEGGKVNVIMHKPFTNELFNELIIYYRRGVEQIINKSIIDITPITEEEYNQIKGEESDINVDLVKG